MRWSRFWKASAPALRAAAGSSVGGDPLAALSDDMSGTDSLSARGFTIHEPALIATQTVGGGEVLLEGTIGSAGGAHWYSQIAGPLERVGSLIYKTVTGNFDVRGRFRCRNAAGTASPSAAAGEWRFGGIQAQDPAGLVSGAYNYVHIGLGSDPAGQNRIEWKVTDSGGAVGPQSTFGSEPGAADLDYDLRMVRDGQDFALYYRRVDVGEALESNTSWTAHPIGTITKDANTPARTGGASPVAFPDTLAVGIMPPYGGPQTLLDMQLTCEGIQYSTP